MTTIMKWKIAAIVVALLPVGFFLVFAIGEGGGGWIHYLQVSPVVALVVLGWYKPKIAGRVLIALGLIFGGLYLFALNSLTLATVAVVELIVFAPILLSGYLFLRAARYRPLKRRVAVPPPQTPAPEMPIPVKRRRIQ